MGQLLDNIRAIYANSRSVVRTSSGTSDWFPVTSGVRQGCNLSPLLFVIYMDQITKEANPDPEALNELMFADDQAMMNNDKTQLQEHIDQLNESCETYSMKISTSKTEVMTVSKRPDKLEIKINGTQLKQTNEFKYLGSMFTENGKLDREIETRCQKANAVSYQLAPLLKHPSISTSTKAKLINAIFLPTLTYQCQTWSLTKDLERKLVTCEMKCLRKAVNKTKRDKIRNAHQTTTGQVVRTHHTYAYKPTRPPGIQHQVLRLESERKTKKTMERLRGRHPQNSRDVPSPGHPPCC